MSGEAASVPQAGEEAGSSGEQSRIAPPAGRARRRVLAGTGLVLVAAVVVLIATDPFGGSTKPGAGVGDNATATSLATVRSRSLSSQTQVSGTLGYRGLVEHSRAVWDGAVRGVSRRRQSVTNAQGMLQTARASLAADSEALAGHEATVSAARAKEAVDCAGDGAAESASSGSPSSGGGGSGLCASDVQAVSKC